MARTFTIRRNRAAALRRGFTAAARLTGLAVLLVQFSSDAAAQQDRPGEYRVKAVYLYNFGKFAQWPAAAEAGAEQNSFAICILGRDPFGPTLDDVVRGESINGQPLVARRIDRLENANGCRILFISTSEQNRLAPILNLLEGKPILTVSELPGFTDRGGMIQFVLDGNRVRFQVNAAPAEKVGLMLSSQLLRVAVSVKGAGAVPAFPNRVPPAGNR